jgi:uncharacterized protein YfaS (alpha-2-macroglobulin family)
MKKHLIPFVTFTGFICMTAMAWFGNKTFTLGDKTQPYDKLWKKVDSCSNKGLTESAMKIIELIYQKAKAENNPSQLVKALLNQAKFQNYKEENSLQKTIERFTKEVTENKFPVKPVIQSILAEAYWTYYQNNRWQIQQRSKLSVNGNDLATWDLSAISNACVKNYLASLSKADSLKNTKVDLFEDIITKGNLDSRKLRPILYDFLLHRAVDFFEDSEADVSRSAITFEINNEDYLKWHKDFLQTKLPVNTDTFNLKYYALKFLQDAEAFHVKDANPDALIDLELERLNWVLNASTLNNKDSLYLRALKNLEEHFAAHSASAEVSYYKAKWYNTAATGYNPLQSDSLKWYNKTAHKIASDAQKEYPESYGATLCKVLLNTINQKELTCQSEQVNEPEKASRVLVKYKNVTEVYFKVLKTSYKNDEEFRRNYYDKKLIDKYLALPVVQNFSYKLQIDEDFNSHSIEVKMPELSMGYYVALTSTTPEFKDSKNIVSYFNFQVSNIAWQNQRLPNGDFEFFVSHRMNGQPLVKAKAQLWFDKYSYLTRSYYKDKGPEYTTDANGMFTINAGGFDEYKNFTIEFTYGNDVLQSIQNFYIYKYNEGNPDIYKTFFFTDRAIYRPGQTIQFKLLHVFSTEKDCKLVPNKQLVVTFKDVNYQPVSTLTLTTNEYGTASGSFIAPQNVLNGQMSINETYGNTYFRVEEYKRPTFELIANEIEGTYKPNDSVTCKIKASAYAGQGIDGAAVKYRVVRNTQLPYWYWWYRPYYTPPGAAEISNGTTTTNDTGGIIIKFKAFPDKKFTEKDNVTFNYSVYADVTDINGETHSTQQSINVGYQSLYLSINTDDKLNKATVKKLFVTAANANYHNEKATGLLKIFALKSPEKIFRTRLWAQADKHLYSREEYYKLFPNDLYEDELNQYKWARGEKVFEIVFKTEDTAGVNISEMKKLPNGVYVMEAICKDEKGKEVKDLKYVTLFSEGENEKQPNNALDWFQESKPVAEPGEKASFIMSSAHKDINYFLQIERDKKIVSRKFIPANMKAYEIPVTEDMRGNFVCHISFIKNNRFFYHSATITVPFSNKELEVTTETFRNKLLPRQAEEWKIVIKNKKGERENAELLASMYDASLDAFGPLYWGAYFYNSYYARIYSQNNIESISSSYSIYYNNDRGYYPVIRAYDELNDFDAIQSYYGRRNYRGSYKSKMRYAYTENEVMADEVSEKKSAKEEYYADGDASVASPAATGAVAQTVTKVMGGKSGEDYQKNDKSKNPGNRDGYLETTTVSNTIPANNEPVQMRKNFNETAFFYPQMQSNEKGEVVIKFTMPDAVTRWKFMTFAHTKDLKSGQMSKELVTQKQIMIQANAPRFFREGDKISFPVKITNTGSENYDGTAEIILLDAITNENITSKLISAATMQTFKADKGKSTSLNWEMTIQEGLGAITYKVVVHAKNVSDGEENTAPVLTNRMLVTESMPLPIRGNQTKTFSFEKLINQNNFSNTLRNHKLTLEFTSNPAWYAVQSLPYLMEYPYECAEQTFSRYYANSLASYIANSKPVIKNVFESWKNSSAEAFYSNLQKNQELKSVMLEETPWVLDAKNENESKRRVGLLFDLNRMSNEMGAANRKLLQMQCTNGGWPWFTGMPDDEYITQHIVCGFGHLDKLGALKIRSDYQWWNALTRAVHYCDNRIDEEYDHIKKYYKDYKTENHLSQNAIQYLYARSFYQDINVAAGNKDAYNYFLQQEKKYWNVQGRYMQSMICLSLFRNNEKATANDIIKSLKENAIQSEEMGMYYKENYAGYYWYESPIEAQSLIIEAFTEVAADVKLADELRIWLLKSKQTQNWKTTKATCEAVYALLLQGTNWLATEPNVEITLGNILVDPKKDPDMKVEAGTGYFKKTWCGTEIKPEMGKVKVEKKGVGISWGAVYWQYFEQLDKITSAETNLKLVKKLFIQKNTSTGPILQEIKSGESINIGDKIKVRIELRVDRDMQYVHMKDMRASCFEPVNVLSGYKWQDGLGYYQSTRDASTNFFFSYLNKGTYVFEYTLNVSHAGNFSNGVTSIQCMYAPEFISHSEGVRVTVKK